MFDLHDVCDLIRKHISDMEEADDLHAVEGGDPDPEREFAARQWKLALDIVRAASRKASS